MKCNICGGKTPRGNFCEHCGAPQEKKGPLKKIKKLIEQKKWIVVLLIILILAATVNLTLIYLTSPQRIVEKYLDALEERNYSEAYQLVRPIREKTLDKKAYIAWQKNEEKQKGYVQQFMISKENKIFDSEANINFNIRRNKSELTQDSLKLIRKGSYLGIFPKWQIDLPMDKRSYKLLYHGVSLFLDGFDTGIKSGMKAVNIQVYHGNHTIEFKGQNARDYLVKSNNEALTILMKPNDQISKEISQDAQKYYDLVLEAYNTGSMDKLKAYFGPGQLAKLNNDFKEKRRYKMVLYKVNKPVDTSQVEIVAPDKVVVFMKFPFDGEMLDYNTQKPKKYFFVLGITRVTYTLKDGRWIMELSNQH